MVAAKKIGGMQRLVEGRGQAECGRLEEGKGHVRDGRGLYPSTSDLHWMLSPPEPSLVNTDLHQRYWWRRSELPHCSSKGLPLQKRTTVPFPKEASTCQSSLVGYGKHHTATDAWGVK